MNDKMFRQFMQTEADTSWIGLGRIRSPEQATPYFCDPIGFREFAGLRQTESVTGLSTDLGKRCLW